ncbi:MAG: histidine kinase dimerization/phospho-acceptor domain-containing protein [Desulfovibrionaceae bacterium]
MRGCFNHHIAGKIASPKSVGAELEAAKEQAQAANRAKSEFLAFISHELRTPPGRAMLGMSEVIQGSELSEQQRRGLEIIQVSGEMLLRLIDDVLEAATLETGRLRQNPRPFDPLKLRRPAPTPGSAGGGPRHDP